MRKCLLALITILALAACNPYIPTPPTDGPTTTTLPPASVYLGYEDFCAGEFDYTSDTLSVFVNNTNTFDVTITVAEVPSLSVIVGAESSEFIDLNVSVATISANGTQLDQFVFDDVCS